MIQIPTEIQELVKKNNQSDVVVNLYLVFMKELNQSFSEIKNIPIPLAIKMIKTLEKEYKKMDKEMKKNASRKY